MRHVETPCLVVGAGPVGLMTSILLARQGIGCLVVDRREGPHRAPQAHVVNPRTLEICRALDFPMQDLRTAATSREDGAHVRFVTRLTGREHGCLPYERQGDDALAFTPTPLLNLSQNLFELQILEQARETHGCNIRYGHRWESLEQDELGVTSRVRDDGSEDFYEVRSRYVLAADGAASRVRRSLGIEMLGPDSIESFMMIHFEANLRPLVKERPAILYWVLDPDSAGSFVAHDIDREWVFMKPYDPATESIANYSEDACANIVTRAIGREDVDLRVKNVSPWTMTAQIASSYRKNHVFLVGDSAHRFPPTGGMGMNTGIQDAHNLVWKLAAVEAGHADPGLLDTYEIERRPVAENNTNQSLTNAMKLIELFEVLGHSADPEASRLRMLAALEDPAVKPRLATAIANQREHFDMFGLQLGFTYEFGALVRDETQPVLTHSSPSVFTPTSRPGSRLPHGWITCGGQTLSTLDLVRYEGLTLIVGRDGEPWASAAGRLLGVPLQCLIAGRDFSDPEGHWARVSEIEPSGALLVRPDQHVAWRAPRATSSPETDLRSAVSTVLGH